MQYDSQLTELKNLLPAAKSILIALPIGASIDKLASGLALFLSLQQQGKEVSIVSDDNVNVSQAYLFGVDRIQKNVSQAGGAGGNMTLVLEGVAASDGTVPALQKLDWFAENNNLNLVFHIMPGQTFQPAKITPKYQVSGFSLVFVIGATNLNNLGNLYTQNSQMFSGAHIVNFDNQTSNSNFGQTNLLDTNAASLSEMTQSVISSLGLPVDADIASNLLAGIFEATNNLTSSNVTADTFISVADCLRAGGKKPQGIQTQEGPKLELNQFMPPSQQVTQTPQNQPSQEERPAGEGLRSAESVEVEPEWLTPKIFKGSSIG
ncbi:hypothetical protein HYW42_01735 [Candidatus Daviesbacteria bacterium]|nr:hypothetical protein [Candidatus Daviesbacteria bacterium]